MSDKIPQGGTPTGCRFKIASVRLLDAPFHIDRNFDYRILCDMSVSTGDFVVVPFGGGNRPQTGLVVSLHETEEDESKLKPIHTVLDKAYSLSEEQLALVEFLRDYTVCSTGDAVHTITPSAAFSRFKEYIVCSTPLPDSVPAFSTEREIYNFIASSENITKSDVIDNFGSRGSRLLPSMLSAGYIKTELSVKETLNIKYTTMYELAQDPGGDQDEFLSAFPLRSEDHKKILLFLRENGLTEQSIITNALNVNSAQIKALVAKGYVFQIQKEAYRLPYSSAKIDTKIKLSQHQQAAADKIITLTKCGEPKAALLHGITGSGKTQVIRAIMDDVIASGRAVIVLVPEISLTPQTVSVFSACYGERTAVLHSGLSAGERFDAWRRIKRGEVDVCIGTRSAIFAPFEKIGLIVLDEEQEHTYKSDSSPKYHARDIARFRCAKHKAVMLLASATPSLESYYKAKNGTYTLVELKERFGSASLPDVKVLDMRTETKNGNFSLFSQNLIEELCRNLDDGKQSILFLNRRGYHSFMNCPSCGAVVTCPHCSVSLTHHHSRFNSKGFLSCHYCGFRTEVPEKCPACQFGKMRFMGYGTQMAEEQLEKLFPQARILRMDADTTSVKFSYDEILGKFRRGEADILLGTQMVSKGHDFPKVTLVGMLSADQSLYLDDYRANERTFSMICQTVGRAGRANDKGNALIQCYTPEHNVIRLAKEQNYQSFYEGEIKLREALKFPPFCDIAVFTVTTSDESIAFTAANYLFDYLKNNAIKYFSNVYFNMFGPFEAPIYKLNEKFRVRIVVKYQNTKQLRAMFRSAMTEFGQKFPQNLTVSVDINPNML